MQNNEQVKEIVGLILSSLHIVAPAVNKAANRGNVSLMQTLFLDHLGRSPKMLTMTEVARWCGHSTAAATGLVDRLEKLGYVERTHAADDRRKVFVRLTPRGLDFVQKFAAILAEEIGEALGNAQVVKIPRDLTALAGVFATLAKAA